MDIQVGDILRMKKEHPCGSKEMLVLRVGADFKLKCTGCGREFMTPRSKCEKKIKSVIRNAVEEEKQCLIYNEAILIFNVKRRTDNDRKT